MSLLAVDSHQQYMHWFKEKEYYYYIVQIGLIKRGIHKAIIKLTIYNKHIYSYICVHKRLDVFASINFNWVLQLNAAAAAAAACYNI